MDNKAIFQEIEMHLLEDEKPSIFLENLRDNRVLEKSVFKILGELAYVPQEPKHHPEGSVWNHTMMVLDEAALRKDLVKNPKVFLWSALLHDIGKKDTTKMRHGRLTAYDHDTVGGNIVKDILSEVSEDKKFIDDVSNLVRFHMHTFYITKNLPFADKESMIKSVDIRELALLSLCDRLGRGKLTQRKIEEEKEMINRFLNIMSYDLKESIKL